VLDTPEIWIMSPTPEPTLSKDTPQTAEVTEIEEEDEGSSESHSEYEINSEAELESSEDDSKQPTAQRKHAPNATREVVKIGKAISRGMNVKNDSESGSESTSVSSEFESQTRPSRRKDMPQAEEAVTEVENLLVSRHHPETNPESSKPKRKAGAGRKRLYPRDENGKPNHFNADGSRIAEKSKHNNVNTTARARSKTRDCSYGSDESSEGEPLMNRYRAHQIEMAIQSELVEESGTADGAQQASDGESSTLSFLSTTPSLPSEEELDEDSQEVLEEVEPETQQDSEGETSILSPLLAALESSILEQAEALQATEPEAPKPSDFNIENGELSEGEIAEDDTPNTSSEAAPRRHFADLRYEVVRQTTHLNLHRHPHDSQETDSWVRKKDGAPVPPYRQPHGKPRTRERNKRRTKECQRRSASSITSEKGHQIA
jgi:hypothetical protein